MHRNRNTLTNQCDKTIKNEKLFTEKFAKVDYERKN